MDKIDIDKLKAALVLVPDDWHSSPCTCGYPTCKQHFMSFTLSDGRVEPETAELLILMKQAMPTLIEGMEVLSKVRWAFKTLADEASDISALHPEINEVWNEGGEAYEASRLVRKVLEKVA